MRTLILLCVCASALAQFEAGFVKILEDKRYQDGGSFGNFRNQEDGSKYFEETDAATGIRRGYWEYTHDGHTYRNEFEAGPGIGFRITNSNVVEPTPVVAVQPQFQPAAPRPTAAPVVVKAAPAPLPAPLPVARQQNLVHHLQPAVPTTTTPHPGPHFQDLFDYPGNLEFSRTSQGHRFKFTAV